MAYNVKNYTEQGGEVTHIGGSLIIENGLAPNQAASSADTVSALKDDFNDLLLKLKNAGVITPDAFTMNYAAVTDSVAGHADRQYNTGKISSVAIEDEVITITLSAKVSDLKDFDGGNGWGTHKWLGIGLGVGAGVGIGLGIGAGLGEGVGTGVGLGVGLGAGCKTTLGLLTSLGKT